MQRSIGVANKKQVGIIHGVTLERVEEDQMEEDNEEEDEYDDKSS